MNGQGAGNEPLPSPLSSAIHTQLDPLKCLVKSASTSLQYLRSAVVRPGKDWRFDSRFSRALAGLSRRRSPTGHSGCGQRPFVYSLTFTTDMSADLAIKTT